MKKQPIMRAGFLIFALFIPLFCFAQVEATINTELANRLVAADVQSKVFVALSKDDWEMFWNIYQQEPRIVNLSFGAWKKYTTDGSLRSLPDNATPLYVAVDRGNIAQVKKLINAGAKVNARCDAGETPLISAIDHQNLKIVDILLKNGAKTEIEADTTYTALKMAIERAGIPIFNRLLKADAELMTDGNVKKAFETYVLAFSPEAKGLYARNKGGALSIWKFIVKKPSLTDKQLCDAAMSPWVGDYADIRADALRLGLAGFASTHDLKACQDLVKSAACIAVSKEHRALASVLREFEKDPKAFVTKYL